jgi:SAM-dependent methyltransferase
VECPVCGGTFPGFALIDRPGGTSRPSERCPGCGARDRNRNLWLYLKNKTNLLSDRLRVLHFAPERIFAKKLKRQKNLDYVSVDLCRPRARVHADITAIPFPESSFDVLLCSHVLEHVGDDGKAMSELFRVLKPGGWGVIVVPIDSRRADTFEDPAVTAPADRQRLFGQADHVRVYGRDFRSRLERAGFAVRIEDYRSELGEARARRYGLRPRTPDIHLCSKPAEGVEPGRLFGRNRAEQWKPRP